MPPSKKLAAEAAKPEATAANPDRARTAGIVRTARQVGKTVTVTDRMSSLKPTTLPITDPRGDT